MRTLVVGDTHGCLDELLDLLQKAELNLPTDRLILLGDYIDRGPQCYELVAYLRGLQQLHGRDKVVLLRGNHEQMAIDHLKYDDRNWFYNGGAITVRSLAANQADMAEVIHFFRSLPLFYTDEHFIYVHAGLRPGVDLDRQQAQDLLWIREEFYRSSYDFGKTVIFGHTPTSFINGKHAPIITEGSVALDTGCVYGHFLSGLEIQNGRITGTYMVAARNNRGKRIA